MMKHEYKVVPTPRRVGRVKGAKTTADRLAATIAELMNEHARDGWEYLRAETLPVDERAGMLSKPVEVYTTVLVFRRVIETRPDMQRERPVQRPVLVATPPPEEPPLRPQPETRREPTLSGNGDDEPTRPLQLGPADRDD